MRAVGTGREGRQPRGASALAISDLSGSAAMRPGATAPDDPEEADPLLEGHLLPEMEAVTLPVEEDGEAKSTT